MVFKRLRDFKDFLSIFEYLAFSVGYYRSLFSVVHPIQNGGAHSAMLVEFLYMFGFCSQLCRLETTTEINCYFSSVVAVLTLKASFFWL